MRLPGDWSGGGKEQKEYRPVVLKVLTKNIRGVAQTLELIEDEQSVNIEGGEEFVIVMYPVKMLEGSI